MPELGTLAEGPYTPVGALNLQCDSGLEENITRQYTAKCIRASALYMAASEFELRRIPARHPQNLTRRKPGYPRLRFRNLLYPRLLTCSPNGMLDTRFAKSARHFIEGVT